MLQQNKYTSTAFSENHFPVVGVGASAGGLDAFKQIVKAIPESSGMAYILVQHFDPIHESILPGIIQKITNIPVHEISDNMTVLPDHIYIMPADKILTATDGVLKLNGPAAEPEKNMAIDIFFESLAEVYRHYAIGVVLCGTGTDGIIGLKAIKDYGGITFAQQPGPANHNALPLNAIHSEIIDFILTPGEIAGKLLELQRKQNTCLMQENALFKNDIALNQILSLIKLHNGIDLSYYKQTIIRKQILRRLVINKIDTPEIYIKHLEKNKAEQTKLYHGLLASGTSFFRDKRIFENLYENVFPPLLENKSLTDPVRIWVAGCSTGEEAYSLAICLDEYLTCNKKNVKIQLFATDVSEKALEKARTGNYTKSELANVAESRINEFFDKVNGYYQVKKRLRTMCVFALQNFLKDPPFAHMDLIVCRNVLMYMEPVLQNKALSSFHYSLKSGGYLQLGKLENIEASNELFTVKSNRFRLYIHKETYRVPKTIRTTQPERMQIMPDETIKNKITAADFRKIADDILLSAYTPAGVVVNDFFDVVQFRGSTSAYLEQPSGKPCLDVIKLAREGLGFELRILLHKAKTSKQPVSKEDIPVDNKKELVTIEVIPLLNTIDLHYLILFKKKHDNKKNINTAPYLATTNVKKSPEYLRIQQLKNELADARKDMRQFIEDHHLANEELQSANEELLSGSEELQILNEDLETSMELIQNKLEGLKAVNRELDEQKERYNNEKYYAEAIVKTMRQPLLVLTNELRIKISNNAFYKTFKVSAHETEGKFLYELGDNQWNIPQLLHKIKNVLNEKSFEDYEISQTFPVIGERTMLLNASLLYKEDNREQLILLAIEDITEKKLLAIKEAGSAGILINERRALHDFFMQTPACLCILRGPQHIFELANPLYIELTGNRDLVGKPIAEALPEFKKQGIVDLLDKVYSTGKSFIGKETPVSLNHENGIPEDIYLNFNYKALSGKDGKVEGILIFAYDVSEQIISRQRVESNAALLRNMYMNAPAFICVLHGPEYIFDLVNPSYYQLFNERRLLGRPLLEALPELREQGYKKILDTVYETEITWIGKEFPIHLAREEHTEPELRYFNLSNQPMFDDKNKINGILTFGYEVTEEIRARKVLAEIAGERIAVLETIPQCAWTANVNGDITYVNRFFVEYTGITKSQTQIWGWTKVIDPHGAEKNHKKYTQLIKTGKDFELELLMKRDSDNSFRWHLLRALAITDKLGKIVSWVGTSTDINDQVLFADVLEKQVAERTRSLKISNLELEHSNKNLEQFAYVASHDLQEPLRKIQLFSSILTNNFDEIPDKAKDLIEKINSSSQRMTALIRDVLNYSKTTRSELTFLKTDLNEILNNTLSEFDLTISQKKATIHKDFLPLIEAIPLQMTQLFYNLISNSLKFSFPDRHPVITISSRIHSSLDITEHPRLHRDCSYFELIFKDNGIGFDQQFVEKVFLIFQRLHNHNQYAGTGIGLALCQNIVNNHGGEIYARAIENEGAVFHILLPVVQSNNRLVNDGLK